MKVLFCTDGSEISFNALKNFNKWAISGVIVDVICVIDWSYIPDSMVIEESGFVSSCRNIADDILEYSAKTVKTLGLNLGKKIKLCGMAVESILETLNSGDYDVVVMGSHGKKGLQRWLGSVSREVLLSSSTPAYISKYLNSCGKILFATDGSSDYLNVVKKAFEIFNLSDKEIYVCIAQEDPDLLFLNGTLDPAWRASIDRQNESYSKNILKDIEKFVLAKGVKITESKLAKGNPPNVIIDFAKKHCIDMIVLFESEDSRSKTFLKNNINSRVIENTKSDTFVINL